jgi:hypothetical protein
VTACGGEVTDVATRSSAAGGTGQVAVHGAAGPTGGSSAVGGVPGSGGDFVSGGLGPTGGAGGGADICGSELGGFAFPAYPALEFVIDIGGSMSEQAHPGTDDPTSKWEALKSLLLPAFQQIDRGWAVGVEYFNLSPGGCFAGETAVPIAPLADAQESIIAASLDSITTSSSPWRIGGYTPTLAAWRHALGAVSSFVDPRCAQGQHFIVLITDSVPSVKKDGCTIEPPISQDEYDAFVDVVRAEGAAANVETFVFGVPGSQDAQGADYDPRFFLSELAIAGGGGLYGCTSSPGTPESDGTYRNGVYCHYDLVDHPDALSSFWTSWGSIGFGPPCGMSLILPSAGGRAVDTWSVEITLNLGGAPGALLKRASDSSCTDGEWYISELDADGNPASGRLCPDVCQMVECAPSSFIQTTVYCA